MARRPPISREQALSARPLTGRIISRKELGNGQVRIEVPFEPRGVHRWLLRLPKESIRDFELDAFGVRLLDMCDGKTSVKRIIKVFVDEYKLDPHEAEHAVVTFLRTLMKGNIVSMVVDKK